jgi:hypothetical protein
MNHKVLNIVKEKIKNLKYKNGNSFPNSIDEISELINYNSYNDIVRSYFNNKFGFNIRNYRLDQTYDLIVPPKERSINNIFLYFPFLFGIIFTITGLLSFNYWTLLLIPIVLCSMFISNFMGRNIIFYLLFILNLLLFYNSKWTLGLLILTFLITIIFSLEFRSHRRKFFLNISLSDEIIFCFLFDTGVLTISDYQINKVIYRGMNTV